MVYKKIPQPDINSKRRYPAVFYDIDIYFIFLLLKNYQIIYNRCVVACCHGGVSKPGIQRSATNEETTPTDLFGWRVVNNAYFLRTNKHTILYCSFEPPTAFDLAVFQFTKLKNKRVQMNKITIATIITITCQSAYAKFNCCEKCIYDNNNSDCTEKCCINKYGNNWNKPTYSPTDLNGVVTVYTYTENVSCALSSTGTTIVSCSKNTSYICGTGYYGSPTNINKTCTQCPTSAEGIVGTTNGNGKTQITDCYIKANTAFSDSTGSGVFSENCNYTK